MLNFRLNSKDILHACNMGRKIIILLIQAFRAGSSHDSN